MIRVTAFRWVPPFAQGQVRDLRVRWALEEAGTPYEEDLVDQETKETEAYRKRQPFGQVPVLEEEGLVLFESGAIVLHVAAKSDVLMPREPAAAARMTSWMFAALNSIEPHVMQLALIDLFHADAPWAKARRSGAEEVVRRRLEQLSTWLGDRPYLEDRFTAGDLLMSSVLRILKYTDLLERTPNLAAYRARCEARPAFGRALEAQLAVFARNQPAA